MTVTIKRLKSFTGHTNKGRFFDEASSIIGWIPRQTQIARPYSSGPTDGVYEWRGETVILCEVAHRRYQVWSVDRTQIVESEDDLMTQLFPPDRQAAYESFFGPNSVNGPGR